MASVTASTVPGGGADCTAGATLGDQRAEVGNVRFVHRGGHGDDDDVCLGERAGVGRHGEAGRGFQVFSADFAGGVAVVPVVVDLGFGQVVADGVEFLAEFHGERQADVAEADDGELELIEGGHAVFLFLVCFQRRGLGVRERRLRQAPGTLWLLLVVVHLGGRDCTALWLPAGVEG